MLNKQFQVLPWTVVPFIICSIPFKMNIVQLSSAITGSISSILAAHSNYIWILSLAEEFDDDDLRSIIRRLTSTFPISVLTDLLDILYIMNYQFEREIKDLIPYKSDYDLWRLCGETEYSFLKLVDELRPVLVTELNPKQTRTAEDWIRIRRDIAIFCVWARQYPTLKTLGEMFGLSEQRIEQIVHFYLPIFHVALCDRYIAWHDDLYWRSLEGKHYFYSYLKRF